MAKIITHLVLSLFRPLFNLQGTGSCSLCFAVRFERLNVLYYITLGFFCQALFSIFEKFFSTRSGVQLNRLVAEKRERIVLYHSPFRLSSTFFISGKVFSRSDPVPNTLASVWKTRTLDIISQSVLIVKHFRKLFSKFFVPAIRRRGSPTSTDYLMPKRFLNLSTRPPVSTSFCLPV